METRQDLAVILASRVPIVVVETHDETRFLDLITGLIVRGRPTDYRPLFRWTVTTGLQRLDIDLAPQLHNAPPDQVLRHVRSVEDPGIYVLLDFHPYLSDPVNVRLVKDIAVAPREHRRTLVFVSHGIELPPELQPLAARFELSLPDDEERREIIREVARDWAAQNPGRVKADPKAVKLLVQNLSGVDRDGVARLARAAIHDDGAITACDLPDVAKAKYELLNRHGLLSFEYDLARFADVGGLGRLKQWLTERRRVVSDPPPGLDPPRGLLLAGVQGCGKSLAARATAGVLGRPLLRLDFAALYDKYHGETERRLRECLAQAELMAPCVLWIDEIEKGLATGDGDSGTSRRVLGSFLTWLAEQQGGVFVVATANEVQRLPPELVRKGRFDELFFVDLPDGETRQKILEIHLKKREMEPKSFDLSRMAQATEGFSGAELEQGIVAAWYTAHADGAALGSGHLLSEFLRTRPLSVVMAERVAGLRSWADGRCVPAA
ncbi:MAG: AAA family ATPase [Chromatiales bacterium]|nr:MAG: AAA family ATPase [Chromatiales bacterium]